jgi:hypothetical protein
MTRKVRNREREGGGGVGGREGERYIQREGWGESARARARERLHEVRQDGREIRQMRLTRSVISAFCPGTACVWSDG